MSFLNVLKQVSMVTAGTAFIFLGSTVTTIPRANAAIFSVGEQGSWITGSDTISNLGFDMVNVSDSSKPQYSSISTLSSSLGDLFFNNPVEKLMVGSGWKTWSNGYKDEVYFSQYMPSITIKLPTDIGAFDFYAEPNIFNIFDIAVTASDGTTITSLSQSVNGLAGAKYFGFYATDNDFISSITITDKTGGAKGLAVGQMRLATKSVPEPSSIIAFLALVAGSIFLKRKQLVSHT